MAESSEGKEELPNLKLARAAALSLQTNPFYILLFADQDSSTKGWILTRPYPDFLQAVHSTIVIPDWKLCCAPPISCPRTGLRIVKYIRLCA